jgi:hypothetical protein
MSLFVVGMHRSGTSLLTALLAMSGAETGSHKALTGPDRHNPKGFWEHNRFRAVNEYLLSSQGREWDCPADFDIDAVDADEPALRARAEEVLGSVRQEGSCFVVKDPRLCLTLSFWQRHCPELVPLVPIRNPVEVAFSLYRRNRIPVPIGIALWEYYVLSAARLALPVDPVVVRHTDLVRDPFVELGRIVELVCERLGPVLELPVESEVRAFFDRSLHRERRGDADDGKYMVSDQLTCWETARAGDIESLSGMAVSEASRAALEGYEALGRQFSKVRHLERLRDA